MPHHPTHLLLLLAAATVVSAQLPPMKPGEDSVPCDRWQVFNDHNAVWSRVGQGCNGGGTTTPCHGESQEGVGKGYFYLGQVESMADCLSAAQEPVTSPKTACMYGSILTGFL